MPKRLVIGNWKMHGSRSGSHALSKEIASGLAAGAVSVSVEVVLCPPSLFIDSVAAAVGDKDIALGAQNVCEYEDGAYTGEVSGSMLREFGVTYVLVGHSERRRYFREDDRQVADKFAAAQNAGLIPVLCIGESLAERQAGETEAILERQLQAVFETVDSKQMQNVVIAYEPVWAIGTGEVATPALVEQVAATVRAKIRGAGDSCRLLYGGSVTPDNAQQLFAVPGIDGLLVGGASLDADKFVSICRVAGG